MSLDDIRLTETIDLNARVSEIRETLLPELDEKITAAEDAEDPDPTPDELEAVRDRLQGQAGACERVIGALDGDGGFVIQELMTAETALLTDDVSERSIDVDYEREEVSGAPKQGYHKVRTLELAVVDAPSGMDAQHDRELGRDVYRVGKLPDLVSDYLYEAVVSLNDTGDVSEVGNCSSYGIPTDGS